MKQFQLVLVVVFSMVTVNVFANTYQQKPKEVSGKNTVAFVNDSIKKVSFGFDFASTLQGLTHDNDGSSSIDKIGTGFTNATGNAHANFELEDGISSYIEVYLSSEHHTEMWMREGYLYIDKLPMYNSSWLRAIMEFTSIKVGQMEINYGDWHFRRSDNGAVNKNPLIGNYIIDANTTEIASEIMFNFSNVEFLIGFSGGTTKEDLNHEHGFANYTKLAYDKSFGKSKRFRISGSYYRVDHSDNPTTVTKNYLYSGNRSGARYQALFGSKTDAGQILPAASQDLEAYMLNILFQLNAWEFFGTYDRVSDKDNNGSDSEAPEEAWNQYAFELVYHASEDFYLAGRYNVATHEIAAGESSDEVVQRQQVGVGYFITKNILTKLEYVTQKYTDFTASSTPSAAAGGSFEGYVLEASVSF